MKPVDGVGVLRANVAEAHVVAHDRSIFGLHQTVVSRAMRTGFGLLDQQLPSSRETV
jgi:hypothetical protein